MCIRDSQGVPPEAETLFASECSMETANSPIFLKFGNARPSNIVEFCNSCWKMAKNAPFHIKSPVKNFHGPAKEGASHRGPPPKYATVPVSYELLTQTKAKKYKKYELMHMRRARAYSSTCSQVILVYLHPFRRNSLFSSQTSPKNH